jgi:hypothetical protein
MSRASPYRELPSICADWIRRWAPGVANKTISERTSRPERVLDLARAAVDCALREVAPLALQAQGFENEALLLRSLERVGDDPSAADAAALAREVQRDGAGRMRFHHALGSAAAAADALIEASSAAADARPLDDAALSPLFGVSGALDMAAYRSIAGGAPRERVLELFAAVVEDLG